MSTMAGTRAEIILWMMPGCGHCHEFAPRFRKRLEEWKQQLESREVAVWEGNAGDGGNAELCARYQITSTPTMLVRYSNGRWFRIEGAVDDQVIVSAFTSACR
jgi:hypothetical protein